MRWRPMVGADLDRVVDVAERVHPDHPEDEAVFEERLALFAAGCAVLSDDHRILGYRIAHPWMLDEPPDLNSLLARLPATPDTLFLHDLALLPEARRRFFASRICRVRRRPSSSTCRRLPAAFPSR